MSDFLSMGGYGVYVWSSYAVFALMLLWDGLAPSIRARRLRRELGRREQRRQARKSL